MEKSGSDNAGELSVPTPALVGSGADFPFFLHTLKSRVFSLEPAADWEWSGGGGSYPSLFYAVGSVTVLPFSFLSKVERYLKPEVYVK